MAHHSFFRCHNQKIFYRERTHVKKKEKEVRSQINEAEKSNIFCQIINSFKPQSMVFDLSLEVLKCNGFEMPSR